jgi:serine/threonine-protein kinase
MVTGQMPFTGADSVLMQKILTEPPAPLNSIRPDLPAALQAIVDRALAKAPDDRYPAAEEMAADLAAVIAELRQGQVLELLPEARRLVEAEEFTSARRVLHQLLQIDSKHTEAKALLAEIHRHLSARQREEKIQQIRQQAEDAFSHNRFDQSLSVLERRKRINRTASMISCSRPKPRGARATSNRRSQPRRRR